MKKQLIFSSGFFAVVLLIIAGISLTSSRNDRRFFKERNITTEEYQFALSIFEREFPPKDRGDLPKPFKRKRLASVVKSGIKWFENCTVGCTLKRFGICRAFFHLVLQLLQSQK